MPMQSPWAQKLKREKEEVPEQFTIVRRYPKEQPAQQSGGYYTGAGVDGVVQPGKMAGQVHEGEGVIPANAMQALTPEEFNGFIRAASDGSLNKNSFRNSFGAPAVQGYQSGGVVNTGGGSMVKLPEEAIANNTAPTQPQTVSTPAIPVQKQETPTTFKIPSTVQQSETQTVSTPNIPVPERPAYTPLKIPTTIQQPKQTVSAPQIEAPKATEATKVTPPPAVTPQVTPAVQQPTAIGSTANEAVRSGLQSIVNQAQGLSETDKKIANYYLSQIDASNAASLRLAESNIANDRTMSQQAKDIAVTGLRNQMEAEKAGVAGQLAISSAQRADQAARDAVSYGQQVRSYEDITLPSARQNMEIQRRTFEEITKPMSEMEIEQMKSNLGANVWNDVQDMIDNGTSLATVNDHLASLGKNPLSSGEFANMLDAGSLGERNWNRQLTYANMLLNTPDAAGNNLSAAAEMFSNLFQGVDYDFTGLLEQANAERFSNGLSQMASYSSAGYDLDTAMKAMEEDGTINMFGGNKELAAQMYNRVNINSLDAEWEEIYNSQDYQNLLNSDNPDDVQLAEDIQYLNTMQKYGLADIEVTHEYDIYEPDGVTKKMTIYAASDEDAEREAASLGKGYTIKDTGKKSLNIKSLSTQTAGTTSQAGTTSDKPAGTVYAEDNRLYQVGAGGVVNEIGAEDITTPWDATADKIVQAGPDNNPYYNDIINQRVNAVLSGESGRRLPELNTDNPVFKKVLESVKDLGVSKERSSALSSAVETGVPVNIDGTVYFVNSKRSPWGEGNSLEYTIESLDGKETKYAYLNQGTNEIRITSNKLKD